MDAGHQHLGISPITARDSIPLDLTRFTSVEDAIGQAEASADGLMGAARRIVEASDKNLTLLNMFLLSSIQRATGLTLAIVDSVKKANPHAAFPLVRSYTDVVVMVLYVRRHPNYVSALIARRGEPGARKRKSMTAINAAVAKQAPGLAAVYDELSEGTHFGSIAMWMAWIPKEKDAGTALTYTTHPRWRQPDTDPLIVCGWLIELNEVYKVVLDSFVEFLRTRDPT